MAAGRIAGDKSFYEWRIEYSPATKQTYYVLYRANGVRTNITRPVAETQEFDSMTSVIKGALGSSFGPAAWWGFKVSAAASLGKTDLKDPDVLARYDELKATKITPNTVRDEAGDRGNLAHDILQALGAGRGEITADAIHLYFEGQLPDGTFYGPEPMEAEDPLPLEKWNLAAGQWWLERGSKYLVPLVEQVVWSEQMRVQGTYDLLGTLDGELELVDYKTHKAAGKGFPAYIEDILQLRGYRMCREDMGLPVPTRQRVVLLQEDGTWLEDTREVPPELFEAVLAVYRGMAALKEG